MIAAVAEHVYRWEALETALRRTVNGYALAYRNGLILIDPPRVPEPDLPRFEALGRPRAVVVTGRFQVRRARQFRDWYGARIFAPAADRKVLGLQADHYYQPGDTLPGGFRAVGLQHQRSPGESALHHPARRMLVCGHLVGDPPGYVQMQEPGLYWSFSRAFEAQLPLLDLDFDLLLPGRGDPIVEEGKIALARYLAGYDPDTAA